MACEKLRKSGTQFRAVTQNQCFDVGVDPPGVQSCARYQCRVNTDAVSSSHSPPCLIITSPRKSNPSGSHPYPSSHVVVEITRRSLRGPIVRFLPPMTAIMQHNMANSAKFATARRRNDVADPTQVTITRSSYLIFEGDSLGLLRTAFTKTVPTFRNT
jgi:hypothetical protein